MTNSNSGGDWKTYLSLLEKKLDLYLGQKAPALPKNAKEAIVKYGPWITLILFVLTLPVILAFFGLGAFLAPLSFLGGLHVGVNYLVSMALSVVVLVLQGLAIPGLFKRQKKAWNLLYYGALIGAVQNLFSFNLGGLVIGTGLTLYILFQVKEYYK